MRGSGCTRSWGGMPAILTGPFSRPWDSGPVREPYIHRRQSGMRSDRHLEPGEGLERSVDFESLVALFLGPASVTGGRGIPGGTSYLPISACLFRDRG